jgi:hypothetical protein
MNEPQNPDSRPDWVHCIRKPKEADRDWSWCGRRLWPPVFALEGLDHAASLQSSRLQPCRQCVSNACAELQRLAPEADQPAPTETGPEMVDSGCHGYCDTCLKPCAVMVKAEPAPDPTRNEASGETNKNT